MQSFSRKGRNEMKKIVRLCAIGAIFGLSLSTYALAQDYKKIDAEYAITSKTIVDPPPGEKKDRVLIFIKGLGARDIYEGIPGAGKKSACSEGTLIKSAGDLECMKNVNAGSYVCGVGILLQTGATVSGLTC
jgi:hypothetical protein